MANADLTPLENAVMDILWRDPMHTVVFKSREQCLAELERIAKTKVWARALTKEQGRKYYLRWLEYFERSHKERIAKFAAEDAAQEILPSVPRPPA
jgi:hypothetical protein